MSDEAKMPDPKVEAQDIMNNVGGWGEWEIDFADVEKDIRSLMARTLRAAAASGRICNSHVMACRDELERMASEIEHGE